MLAAAGHRVARRREGPAGLTAREIDVLRLVSRGLSSKEIAARLVISPKTARNHIEHIYVKIGASSRVGASLFAMQHGLLPDEELGDLAHRSEQRWGNRPMRPGGPRLTLPSLSKRQSEATMSCGAGSSP